jgi:hypothetical protein
MGADLLGGLYLVAMASMGQGGPLDIVLIALLGLGEVVKIGLLMELVLA